MRLTVIIHNQLVVILVDTGSTHSFVNPNAAKKARLPVQEKSQLTIKVVNGDTIPCQGICKPVKLPLQDHSFTRSNGM
jgi:predicted aspartyl protease